MSVKTHIRPIFFVTMVTGCGLCQPVPNPENDLIKRGAAMFVADSRFLRDAYSHKEYETTQEFKNGVVKKREEKLSYVEGRDQKLYKKLLAKNGMTIDNSSFELKKEFVPLDERFFSRFNYTLESVDSASGGKSLWVLYAKPKPNLPENERSDRILNNLEARIFIDPETSQIRKIVAQLSKPVEYAWPGILGGQVLKIEVTVEIGSVGGHLAVVRVQAEYKYAVKALLWPINGHATKNIQYRDYERRKS